MRSFGRLALVGGTAAAVALGVAGAADAAPAHKPITAHFTFTPRHQSFNYSNAVGRLHAQVAVTGKHVSKQYPMPWAFVITNAKLRAIARGPATCVASGLNGRYHDKHVVPVGYTWHSTVKPHRAKKVYLLYGSCRFNVQEGRKVGYAIVSFQFRYAIDPHSRARVASAGTGAFTTSVRVVD
ncbi:hypothetical protein [Actinomadura gamaensis]|uniref:Uncharacterized protein n=1 Tax=Actinomadura gamaensis TaxID=1763541 RepID=A0ABV9U151_9ACTN